MSVQPVGDGFDASQFDCSLTGPNGKTGVCAGRGRQGNQFTRLVGKLEPIDDLDKRFGPQHHAGSLRCSLPNCCVAAVRLADPQHELRQNHRQAFRRAGVGRNQRCHCRLH